MSKRFLDSRGYNIQVPGSYAGSYFGNERKYNKFWDARAARLRDLDIVQPFLIPSENPEPEFFKKNKDKRAGGYTFEQFLDDPKTAKKIAKVIAKENRPWSNARTDLLNYAAAESNAFVINTVLVVPYTNADVATMSTDSDVTDSNVLPITGAVIVPDSNPHKSSMNSDVADATTYRNFGMWAAKAAAEIRTAVANFKAGTGPQYGCLIVHQVGVVPTDTPHVAHQNAVVIDLGAMTAIHLEPHMSNDPYDDFIPYQEIQASVASFLRELKIETEPSPTSCTLQSDDMMCASWSYYLAALYMANPGIDHQVLAETVSYLDIYRMLYVAYLWVPMRRGNVRRGGKPNFSRMWEIDPVDDGEPLDVRPNVMAKFKRQFSKPWYREGMRAHMYTDRAELL